jgi:mono/diheme cytochrome c family protein
MTHTTKRGATRLVPWMPCLLVLLAGVHLIGEGVAGPAGGPTPDEYRKGEAKFKASCARCHGERAVGTDHGPPLVHKIYEPNHHGDAAFQRAAANGVRAHHWKFGDMPRIEGVTPKDVDQIIQYVRWLQRQAGIM